MDDGGEGMGQNTGTESIKVLPTSPAMSEMVVFLLICLSKPILTTHVFQGTSTCHKVFFQGATTKMTVETLRSFHVVCGKCTL